ncbi:uncharacterized protein LOC135341095 isoform X5 [Halichondria panicea]|uniref:uncharacterized protein LOC135341095 isoform X5 n=1 Tax=Halichondria panicea TaxID=6063 RepID=UPI00312B6F50
MTVSYECTVTDPLDPPVASTVWQGSAFTCSSSKISFLHSSFEPNGVSGSCGDLSAMSVGVNGNEYTSRLTLTATAELNGMTINCTLSSVVDFGSDTVKTGGEYFSLFQVLTVRYFPVPPHPPQSAVVDITSTSSLTVSWAPPSETSNVGGYLFTVTGEDCGRCENTTVSADTTSVICSGWTASSQTCAFDLRSVSQDCGFTSDTAAVASVVLSGPPSQLSLGNLQQTCLFESTNAVLSWTAPSGYPPVQIYHVMINNGAIMSTSGAETSITIPGSIFISAGTYSFSVRAVNILGESAPLLTDLDGMINVAYEKLLILLLPAVALTSVLSSNSVTMMSVTLTFSLSNAGCVGPSVSIIVYYQECTDQVNCQCPQDNSFSTNEQSMSIASTSFTIVYSSLRASVIYCYRSEVVNAGIVVGFENGRMFTTTPPVPPALLASARLVSSNPPTYQCVNSAEGFNGGSSHIVVASYDPTIGTYSVPACSRKPVCSVRRS